MKKVFTIGILMLLTITSFFILINRSKSISIIYTNVEALAQSEQQRGKKCYNTFVNDPDDSDIYCQTCEELPGRGSDKSNCYK